MKTNSVSQHTIIIIIILILITIIVNYYFNNKNNNDDNDDNDNDNNDNNNETFINSSNISNDTLFESSNTNENKPVEIKSQIPVPANQLNNKQLIDIDSNILKNNRLLKKFSMADELDVFQIYNILKKMKDKEDNFNYNINNEMDKLNQKSMIKKSELITKINSGAINNVDIELFTRIKIEIISLFNNLVISSGYYIEFHPYHFFKIINSNLISFENKDVSRTNYIFTLTLAREFKFQQFVIYYDIDLISNTTNTNTNTNTNNTNYKLVYNKIELTGIKEPNSIEFHNNSKIEEVQTNNIEVELEKKIDKEKNNNYYYKDQITDNALFDILPNEENSKLFQKQNTKFINIYERTDIDPTLLDKNSIKTDIDNKIMNMSKDQQYKNHKCFGLVNGISEELSNYNNPIFCKSYHPEINQNGIWDAPCQIDNDCPFFKANKNYTNNKGKCDKTTGMCEMPHGIIPIGFTKYGKIEPDCYNCGITSLDNKCCKKQSEDIEKGNVNYISPDYIFTNDENERTQYKEQIESLGLKVNPSI
jgi:hypothetical protein